MSTKEVWHFWKSAQCRQNKLESCNLNNEEYFHNFALIDGKEVMYDIASSTEKHGCEWPDTVYLGKGYYSRSERVWSPT
jgi:hypothetical protein